MYTEKKHKEAIRLRRKREKEQRYRSILDAAQKVFFSEGYAKTTMDKIAYEAAISKPTIYQYFKTKEDLYFSLMLPVIEDIAVQIGKIEVKLKDGKYPTGEQLLKDLFKAAYSIYAASPDVFRIIQLFQQSGLIGKLNEEISSALDEKGRLNFELFRRIIQMGIEGNLIIRIDPAEAADTFWGLFVGVVQLQNIKVKGGNPGKRLKKTLKLAEKILIDSVAVK